MKNRYSYEEPCGMEWVFIDRTGKDWFKHKGDTIVPGAGTRWKHLHRSPESAAAAAAKRRKAQEKEARARVKAQAKAQAKAVRAAERRAANAERRNAKRLERREATREARKEQIREAKRILRNAGGGAYADEYGSDDDDLDEYLDDEEVGECFTNMHLARTFTVCANIVKNNNNVLLLMVEWAQLSMLYHSEHPPLAQSDTFKVFS